MDILILSHFAGSSEHGMVFRNYAMAREWVRQGHSVTIVATGYSHMRQKQPQFKGRVGEENLEGIRYIWVWGPRYKPTSMLGRIFSMATYTAQCLALPLPLDKRYDIVMCSSPHPFAIYPATRWARRFKARLIFDIRDLWPLTPLHLSAASARHPFIRLLQAAEDYACRHADLVTAVPHNAEAYLQSRGLSADRFLAIPNGAIDDLPTHPLPNAHSETLRQLKADGAFIIGYAGTLGTANAMNVIVEALSAAHNSVHLVMLGDGACREQLRAQAHQLNCSTRVHFLPPVGRHQVAHFLSFVDVAYAGGHKSPLYTYGASVTKLNDYMLASIPTLYSMGDLNNAIEMSGAGISCEPDNPPALAQAINTLMNLPKSELEELGKIGRAWCLEHQLVSTLCKKIIHKINQSPQRT